MPLVLFYLSFWRGARELGDAFYCLENDEAAFYCFGVEAR